MTPYGRAVTSHAEGPSGEAGRDPERVAGGEEDATAVAPAGRFRLYLGASAGVGKTCAMLDEGWRRKERGTDVVVGFVETHGRPHTAALLRNLEVVPRVRVEHRGATFEEMDLAAVLARRPQVALVDELAHTNVPGSGPHEKRYEDVLALLESGISVISTVNIQHLESLADAVERMTGAQVRERVPDWVVHRANQIELVDSSPEQLRRRMLHGNIYPQDKIPQALAHFFRTENLVALRELALRFLADETEEELLDYLRRHHVRQVWETAERIMVGVTAAAGTEAVVRRAARMAARSKAELHVVHVGTGDAGSPGAATQLERVRQLAAEVGATFHELAAEDPVQALISFARDHQITQIVLGASRRSRWRELTSGSVIRHILRAAAETGIDVHVIARSTLPLVPPGADERP